MDDLLRTMDCGTLENNYGPFDYTDPAHVAEQLPIVEQFHFNKNVEALTRGMTAEMPGSDLDYTLRAFPNHHRALYSMGRYALKYPNSKTPPGANYSGDCYFERAIRFSPRDPTVRLVYAIYLSMKSKHMEAITQLKEAEAIDSENAEIQYNLGLLYAKVGDDETALSYAKRAYGLGYPLQGLKNILVRRGVWE